jgi:hypothetical protein
VISRGHFQGEKKMKIVQLSTAVALLCLAACSANAVDPKGTAAGTEEPTSETASKETASTFCAAWEKSTRTTCSKTLDKSDCIELASGADAEALAAAKACLKKKCADVAACIDEALGTDSAASLIGGGTTEPEPKPEPAPACSLKLKTGQATCDSCMGSKCCAQDNACAGSSSCVALLNCVVKCPNNDSACVDACASSYPSGVTPLTNWISCMDKSCGTSCQ